MKSIDNFQDKSKVPSLMVQHIDNSTSKIRTFSLKNGPYITSNSEQINGENIVAKSHAKT